MTYKQSDLDDLIRTKGQMHVGVVLPLLLVALTCGGFFFLV